MGIVKEAMKANNVRMVEALVDLDFLGHFFLLICFHHQLFGHDLARKDIIRLNIDDFVAFGKASLLIFLFECVRERERIKGLKRDQFKVMEICVKMNEIDAGFTFPKNLSFR
jgi:hypothetical protein